MKRFCLICLLVIFFNTTAYAALCCPSNWVEAGGSCFKIETGKKKYDQAVESCENLGGRLASFTEGEFTNLGQHIGTADFWIGLNCTENCNQKSNWGWMDGTPAGTWVEKNWVFNEPDIGEHHGRVTDTKKWAGLYSSFDIGYICKQAPSSPCETESSSTTSTSTTASTSTSKSTKVSTTTTTTTTIRPTVSTKGESPGTSGNDTNPFSTDDKSTHPTLDGNKGHGSGFGSNHGDSHLGMWIGMGCLFIASVIVLGLGIFFYNKSRRPKRPITPVRPMAPPRTPPPAYNNTERPNILVDRPLSPGQVSYKGGDVALHIANPGEMFYDA